MSNQFCECADQGRILTYCPRYGRDMGGRFREICAGVNCDLGTAAAFREQWQRESPGIPAHMTPEHNRIPLLLKTDQAPGDAVVMTAVIYSLHRAHPGKYITAVESPYPEVFAYNPNVTGGNNFLTGKVSDSDMAKVFLPIQMHYPAIHQSNERGIHFMQGWCEHLSRALGVPVPLMTNRPHLYFKNESWPPSGVASRYWVVCSGGKPDLTNKLWGHENYQRVVSMLRDDVKFIQVGANETDHPPLAGPNVHNMVGKTNLRQLFHMIRGSRGVLCGVSLPMHVAAALERPAVVVAGGREPVQWNAYPRQQYVHTVGALPCIDPQGRAGACWRSRTIPLGDSDILDADPCLMPVNGSPACMRLISPGTVAELVLRYNCVHEIGGK